MSVLNTITNAILPSIVVIFSIAVFCIVMNFAARHGTKGAKVGASIASFFVCLVGPMGIPVLRTYYIQYFNDFWNWIWK